MTDEARAAITTIEDATTSRWLKQTLALTRNRVQAEPTEEALERIRARVFGATPKKERTLAA